MGLEIERKFLVTNDAWREGAVGVELVQGYLATDPQRSIRVRLAGERAWLTIKGETVGLARAEFEYEIPVADARDLLGLCHPVILAKTRFLVEHAVHTWEVDEFHDDCDGLIMAEVELASEDEEVALPAWVGEEVSHDPRYTNACLSKHPYTQWEQR